MGIPGLTRDLKPYTERANLGRKHQVDGTVGISSVVIDGPSFVYHVYNQQMKSLPQVISPIAYRDINEGVVSLLEEIQFHGVDMYGECYLEMSQLTPGNSKKIYFDGALPVTKRETRKERLEMHRRLLDFVMDRQLIETTMIVDPSKQPAKGEELLQTMGGYSELNTLKAWEPPFMVASVIEHLRKGRYSSLVQVIPDEAEVGCLLYACRASQEEVAILSNDSDLLVYPSASDKSLTLVLLRSLEQVIEFETGTKVLMANCLRPSEIIRRLQIPSLHLLAFQRRLDPSASFGMLKQRAKTPPVLTEILQKFDDFISDYPVDILDQAQGSVSKCSSVADPRLAELQYQYLGSRHAIASDGLAKLHMYLPSLFEDTDREAPWKHGSELRELAYSLFNLSTQAQLSRNTYIEYSRRGRLIRPKEVVFLSSDELVEVFDEETSLLQQVHSCNTTDEAIAMWHQLALEEVDLKRQVETRFNSLPTFHLSACVQAVLYSLRILKQVWELVRMDQRLLNDDQASVLDKLMSLPDLAEMMDALRALYPVR